MRATKSIFETGTLRDTIAGVRPHLHIPTPGDHYSPSTGSAVMTVIHGMACEHAAVGGRTELLVSRGTKHDYEIGDCREVDPTVPPPKWKKALDLLVGRLGGRRYFAERAYLPHCRAIGADFEGHILIHNGPEAVQLARAHAPRSHIGLWLHNPVFQHYTKRETERVEAAADALLCVSNVIAKSVESRLGRQSPKVRVVHNGVDVDYFRPSPEPLANETCTLLFVGRIVPVKGVDLLLRAGQILQREGLDFRIRIVGSSNFNAADSLSEYERLLRDLAEPIKDRVVFQPFVDRLGIVREYQHADIFCAPSNWDEPFGLTIAEAMACGLPVVTTRRGGIPEFAGDNVLYFTPPDVEELAARLRTFITDAEARRELGLRARVAATKLDWACAYQQLRSALS